jgi:hypothetical protein
MFPAPCTTKYDTTSPFRRSASFKNSRPKAHFSPGLSWFYTRLLLVVQNVDAHTYSGYYTRRANIHCTFFINSTLFVIHNSHTDLIDADETL